MEQEHGKLEMIVKRVSVPVGLEELMEGLTKEVLLKKPKDLYLFAAEYFSRLIILREKSSTRKALPMRAVQSITQVKAPDMGKTSLRPTRNLSRQLSVRGKQAPHQRSKERQTDTSSSETTPRDAKRAKSNEKTPRGNQRTTSNENALKDSNRAPSKVRGQEVGRPGGKATVKAQAPPKGKEIDSTKGPEAETKTKSRLEARKIKTNKPEEKHESLIVRNEAKGVKHVKKAEVVAKTEIITPSVEKVATADAVKSEGTSLREDIHGQSSESSITNSKSLSVIGKAVGSLDDTMASEISSNEEKSISIEKVHLVDAAADQNISDVKKGRFDENSEDSTKALQTRDAIALNTIKLENIEDATVENGIADGGPPQENLDLTGENKQDSLDNNSHAVAVVHSQTTRNNIETSESNIEKKKSSMTTINQEKKTKRSTKPTAPKPEESASSKVIKDDARQKKYDHTSRSEKIKLEKSHKLPAPHPDVASSSMKIIASENREVENIEDTKRGDKVVVFAENIAETEKIIFDKNDAAEGTQPSSNLQTNSVDDNSGISDKEETKSEDVAAKGYKEISSETSAIKDSADQNQSKVIGYNDAPGDQQDDKNINEDGISQDNGEAQVIPGQEDGGTAGSSIKVVEIIGGKQEIYEESVVKEEDHNIEKTAPASHETSEEIKNENKIIKSDDVEKEREVVSQFKVQSSLEKTAQESNLKSDILESDSPTIDDKLVSIKMQSMGSSDDVLIVQIPEEIPAAPSGPAGSATSNSDQKLQFFRKNEELVSEKNSKVNNGTDLLAHHVRKRENQEKKTKRSNKPNAPKPELQALKNDTKQNKYDHTSRSEDIKLKKSHKVPAPTPAAASSIIASEKIEDTKPGDKGVAVAESIGKTKKNIFDKNDAVEETQSSSNLQTNRVEDNSSVYDKEETKYVPTPEDVAAKVYREAIKDSADRNQSKVTGDNDTSGDQPDGNNINEDEVSQGNEEAEVIVENKENASKSKITMSGHEDGAVANSSIHHTTNIEQEICEESAVEDQKAAPASHEASEEKNDEAVNGAAILKTDDKIIENVYAEKVGEAVTKSNGQTSLEKTVAQEDTINILDSEPSTIDDKVASFKMSSSDDVVTVQPPEEISTAPSDRAVSATSNSEQKLQFIPKNEELIPEKSNGTDLLAHVQKIVGVNGVPRHPGRIDTPTKQFLYSFLKSEQEYSGNGQKTRSDDSNLKRRDSGQEASHESEIIESLKSAAVASEESRKLILLEKEECEKLSGVLKNPKIEMSVQPCLETMVATTSETLSVVTEKSSAKHESSDIRETVSTKTSDSLEQPKLVNQISDSLPSEEAESITCRQSGEFPNVDSETIIPDESTTDSSSKVAVEQKLSPITVNDSNGAVGLGKVAESVILDISKVAVAVASQYSTEAFKGNTKDIDDTHQKTPQVTTTKAPDLSTGTLEISERPPLNTNGSATDNSYTTSDQKAVVDVTTGVEQTQPKFSETLKPDKVIFDSVAQQIDQNLDVEESEIELVKTTNSSTGLSDPRAINANDKIAFTQNKNTINTSDSKIETSKISGSTMMNKDLEDSVTSPVKSELPETSTTDLIPKETATIGVDDTRKRVAKDAPEVSESISEISTKLEEVVSEPTVTIPKEDISDSHEKMDELNGNMPQQHPSATTGLEPAKDNSVQRSLVDHPSVIPNQESEETASESSEVAIKTCELLGQKASDVRFNKSSDNQTPLTSQQNTSSDTHGLDAEQSQKTAKSSLSASEPANNQESSSIYSDAVLSESSEVLINHSDAAEASQKGSDSAPTIIEEVHSKAQKIINKSHDIIETQITDAANSGQEISFAETMVTENLNNISNTAEIISSEPNVEDERVLNVSSVTESNIPTEQKSSIKRDKPLEPSTPTQTVNDTTNFSEVTPGSEQVAIKGLETTGAPSEITEKRASEVATTQLGGENSVALNIKVSDVATNSDPTKSAKSGIAQEQIIETGTIEKIPNEVVDTTIPKDQDPETTLKLSEQLTFKSVKDLLDYDSINISKDDPTLSSSGTKSLQLIIVEEGHSQGNSDAPAKLKRSATGEDIADLASFADDSVVVEQRGLIGQETLRGFSLGSSGDKIDSNSDSSGGSFVVGAFKDSQSAAEPESLVEHYKAVVNDSKDEIIRDVVLENVVEDYDREEGKKEASGIKSEPILLANEPILDTTSSNLDPACKEIIKEENVLLSDVSSKTSSVTTIEPFNSDVDSKGNGNNEADDVKIADSEVGKDIVDSIPDRKVDQETVDSLELVGVSKENTFVKEPERKPKIGDIEQVASVIEVVRTPPDASDASVTKPVITESSPKTRKSGLALNERSLSSSKIHSRDSPKSSSLDRANEAKIRRTKSVGIIKPKDTEVKSKIPTSAGRRSAGRRPLIRQMETSSKELAEKLNLKGSSDGESSEADRKKENKAPIDRKPEEPTAEKAARTASEDAKAALTIQSAWKGFVTRKMLKSQHSAVVKIQAVVRGFLERLRLDKLKTLGDPSDKEGVTVINASNDTSEIGDVKVNPEHTATENYEIIENRDEDVLINASKSNEIRTDKTFIKSSDTDGLCSDIANTEDVPKVKSHIQIKFGNIDDKKENVSHEDSAKLVKEGSGDDATNSTVRTSENKIDDFKAINDIKETEKIEKPVSFQTTNEPVESLNGHVKDGIAEASKDQTSRSERNDVKAEGEFDAIRDAVKILHQDIEIETRTSSCSETKSLSVLDASADEAVPLPEVIEEAVAAESDIGKQQHSKVDQIFQGESKAAFLLKEAAGSKTIDGSNLNKEHNSKTGHVTQKETAQSDLVQGINEQVVEMDGVGQKMDKLVDTQKQVADKVTEIDHEKGVRDAEIKLAGEGEKSETMKVVVEVDKETGKIGVEAIGVETGAGDLKLARITPEEDADDSKVQSEIKEFSSRVASAHEEGIQVITQQKDDAQSVKLPIETDSKDTEVAVETSTTTESSTRLSPGSKSQQEDTFDRSDVIKDDSDNSVSTVDIEAVPVSKREETVVKVAMSDGADTVANNDVVKDESAEGVSTVDIETVPGSKEEEITLKFAMSDGADTVANNDVDKDKSVKSVGTVGIEAVPISKEEETEPKVAMSDGANAVVNNNVVKDESAKSVSRVDIDAMSVSKREEIAEKVAMSDVADTVANNDVEKDVSAKSVSTVGIEAVPVSKGKDAAPEIAMADGADTVANHDLVKDESAQSASRVNIQAVPVSKGEETAPKVAISGGADTVANNDVEKDESAKSVSTVGKEAVPISKEEETEPKVAMSDGANAVVNNDVVKDESAKNVSRVDTDAMSVSKREEIAEKVAMSGGADTVANNDVEKDESAKSVSTVGIEAVPVSKQKAAAPKVAMADGADTVANHDLVKDESAQSASRVNIQAVPVSKGEETAPKFAISGGADTVANNDVEKDESAKSVSTVGIEAVPVSKGEDAAPKVAMSDGADTAANDDVVQDESAQSASRVDLQAVPVSKGEEISTKVAMSDRTDTVANKDVVKDESAKSVSAVDIEAVPVSKGEETALKVAMPDRPDTVTNNDVVKDESAKSVSTADIKAAPVSKGEETALKVAMSDGEDTVANKDVVIDESAESVGRGHIEGVAASNVEAEKLLEISTDAIAYPIDDSKLPVDAYNDGDHNKTLVKRETEAQEPLQSKPNFYRADTVVEPVLLKKAIPRLGDLTSDDSTDDNNNTDKQETALEREVRVAVADIVKTPETALESLLQKMPVVPLHDLSQLEDDFSSVDSADSVVTVIMKPKPEISRSLPSRTFSTSALEDRVELLDQVQNSLLDQLSGKTTDSKSKFDINELRKELHDTTLYTDEQPPEPEVLEYLYDFEPEDEAGYERIVRTPMRDLPDIAEEEDISDQTGNLSNVIVIDDEKIEIGKEHQRLLHTSELHDSVLLTNGQPLWAEKGVEVDQERRLKHTSEFHDTVVVPLASGEDVKITNVSKGAEMGEGDVKADRRDSGNQTANQQPPAGVEAVTSRRGVSGAQASLKDAAPAGPEPTRPAQSLARITANEAMESENNNNRKNNAIAANLQEKSMEAEAATKIQAGFRGYQVRKQLKAKNASLDQKRQLRKRTSRDNMKNPDLQEKSAVKIQAGVRGFLVRMRQKKRSNNSSSSA